MSIGFYPIASSPECQQLEPFAIHLHTYDRFSVWAAGPCSLPPSFHSSFGNALWSMPRSFTGNGGLAKMVFTGDTCDAKDDTAAGAHSCPEAWMLSLIHISEPTRPY